MSSSSSAADLIAIESWRESLTIWVGLTFAGLYAVLAAAAGVAASAERPPLVVLAEWVIASGQHVEWSAPTLIAAAFALATICAAPREALDERGSPTAFFAYAAHVVAVILTVWLLMALLSLFALDQVSAQRPLESFARVSGLLLCAPLGIAAGLSAGRFTLAPLERRRTWAEKSARDSLADIHALGPRFSSTTSLRRIALRGFPAALGVVCVAFVGAAAHAQRLPATWSVTLPFMAGTLYAIGWSALSSASVLFSQPDGPLWRKGVRRKGVRRQPTRWGKLAWTGIGALALLFIGLTLALAYSLASDPEAARSDVRAMWSSILVPVITCTALALYFSSPPLRLLHHDRTLEVRKRDRLRKVRNRLRLERIARSLRADDQPPARSLATVGG